MALKALYGAELAARFAKLRELLPSEGTLLDVCAGDGAIADQLAPGVKYIGVDGNAAFVAALKRRGLEAHLLDVRKDPLPRADTVLMMGSLYHFYPEQRRIVEKLKRAARRRAIVVEPHVNWSSKGGLLGWLSQRLSDPGIPGSYLGRLSAEDLEELATQRSASALLRMPREFILLWNA
jgi:SAM-dependent methyltransferase